MRARYPNLLRQAWRLFLRGGATALGVFALAHSAPVAAQTIKGGWGPFDVNLNLGLQFEVEYTDNTNNSETDPEEEVFLKVGPYLGGTVGLDVPVMFSGGQRMSISTSLAYTADYSLKTGEWTENLNSPVTVAVVVPFWIYGWDVILSDTFTFTNEPLETSFGFGRDTEEFTNLASANIGRRFGRVGMNASGSREDIWAPDAPTIEQTTYSISLVPSYYLRNNYSVFANFTAGWTFPEDPTRRESNNYLASFGVAGQIMQNVSGSASVGWAVTHLNRQVVNTDGGPIVLPSETIDGPTLNLNLNYAQALRPNTTHSLSLFHSPGITAALEDSDLQRITAATYTISHRLSRYLVLSPSVGWQFIEDISGVPPREEVHLVRVGLALQRSFGKRLSGNLRYEFQTRSSNIAGQSYDVNRVIFTLLYTF